MVLDYLLYPFRQVSLWSRRVQVYGVAYYIYSQYCGYETSAEGLEGAALDDHWDAAHEHLAGVAVWHATSLLGL
eukprot:CAMPEP_0119285758 /NCGR_PEP_ID=MMETSP1329-20130426/32788_1 /TAXON_ID=114041 /ORGANISM="Genus nov. species nov., Strain RCC1024" /LENGTH=73 /DNA_ID=CAMNT_0007286477 /DNA_START=192 /DNA_END=409 /DNA_ORIENTATION=-